MAKKTTKKKSSKKKIAAVGIDPDPKASGRKYVFDVLSDDAVSNLADASETLEKMRSRRKNRPTGLKKMSEIRNSMIPLRSFMLQYAFGCYGIPEHTLMEIVGPENIGKTTLLYWLFGGAMSVGVPCALQESEGKIITKEWAKRALHPNVKIADRMAQQLSVFSDVYQLSQMEENLYDWVRLMREEKGVPLSTPLIMGVDTISKMMSNDEAAGFRDYADNMNAKNKKAFKETATGSNFGHSKWSHAFCRRLPSFLADNNVLLIIVSHQNENFSMNSGPSFMSAETGALFNKKKIGGRAINQNAALQIILSRVGMHKNSAGKNIGHKIKMRVDKNSYGPANRIVEYTLQNDDFDDTEELRTESIQWHEGLAKWFTDEGILGTKANLKRYTSEALGVNSVTSYEFEEVFNNSPDVMNRLGKQLQIYGYENVVDEVLKNVEESAIIQQD